MTYQRASSAASAIANLTGRANHNAAIVLGSGLSTYAEGLPKAITIPYSEIPGFPVSAVAGHAGTLVSAEVGSGHVLVLAGRAHLYEGHTLPDIVLPVRAAAAAGCSTVVLTNAAGGVNRSFTPGDLVVITDHLNLTGQSPLIGPNDDQLGPRFPDMTEAYSARLREAAFAAAQQAGVDLRQGIYAWMTGPTYETPAEIRMAATLGADLVGMSTVPETIALRHMDREVLGLSLVTNMAAGMSDSPLSHGEVQQTAQTAAARFTRLLDHLLPDLVSQSPIPSDQ